MADEKKVYSIVGKVEIGTDEYRDLIEGLAEANKRAEKSNADYWEIYRRANKAEDELKDITAKYNELFNFIKSDETVETKLKLYRIEKMNREEKEN